MDEHAAPDPFDDEGMPPDDAEPPDPPDDGGEWEAYEDGSPPHALPVHPLAPHLPAQPTSEARGGLWLYYLFLRPRIFFEHFVLTPIPLMTALAAWLYGITGAMDQIEQRALKSDLGGRPNPFDVIPDSWATYWAFCLGLGVIGGIFFFSIGGWWYRVRLEMSGAPMPDHSLARRVYLFACQVYAIPILLHAGWQTTAYPSPSAAREGDDWTFIVPILFLFWSVYTSYRGVRTLFVVRPWAARAWFLLLPSGIYAVGLVAVAAFYAIQFGLFSSEPNVEQPELLDRPGFSLSYPANWDIDTEDEDYDPDYSFAIASLNGDAKVWFQIYEEPIDTEAHAEAAFAAYASAWQDVRPEPISRWGNHEGYGYRFEMVFKGMPCVGRMFSAGTEAASFNVLEVAAAAEHATQSPGFDLIAETFELKEPPAGPESPDTE